MDANGLRFWMLANERDWNPGNGTDISYDAESRTLQLASERLLPPAAVALTDALDADARSRLERVPQTRDAFDTRAWWDVGSRTVMASGALPDAVPIYEPSDAPTDLVMGNDGVLYMAVAGGVVMHDQRSRWKPVTLIAAGLTVWRLAPNLSGGAWALDRANRKLARVEGLPFPDRPFAQYSPNTVRPCLENPDPPRLSVLPATLPADETAVAIACSPEGRLALLTWTASSDARVRCLTPDGALSDPTNLSGAPRPYSIAWVDAGHVAVLTGSLSTEAPVYPVGDSAQTVLPVGDIYPLQEHDGGPFVHGFALPPQYPTVSGTSPLYPLSLPSFASFGETAPAAFDSGSTQTVWHRLYLEAFIPDHTGIVVTLAATDNDTPPSEAHDWHEHRFGEMVAHRDGTAVPRGAWMSMPSEIPYHPGLLSCPRQTGRSGLFTALIQRSNRPVRALRGRYLWIRVSLYNEGRATPMLAALRAYASRFSYRDHYLPELYHEMLFGDDADAVADGQPGTPADFLERFLDNFEGILTPLEDRIADAYLLTDPRTTPDESLEWLGSWIGVAFDPAYPADRRRKLLTATPELYRRRATVGGLTRALDIATDGGVANGSIVVLEDFRLRRVIATILGTHLDEEYDPLLAGPVISGNSYVGDTLFLGNDLQKEFLALFDPSPAGGPALPPWLDGAKEEAAVASFFDGLANRVTVLVHQEVKPQDLGLIQRVVDLETPAHVLSRVVTATYPFVVGMASLAGVDSYLGPPQQPEPLKIGSSQLGVRDLVEHPASLDPRLEGGWLDEAFVRPPPVQLPPVAEVTPPGIVELGHPFILDASESHAAPGHRITDYIWTLTE